MSILIPTSKKESNKTMDSNFNGLPTLPSWFDDILGKGFTSEYLSNFNTGITLPAVNVIESNDEFILEGKGWGHGVGLCQIGALGMALSKKGAKLILNHYYPGAKINTIYNK